MEYFHMLLHEIVDIRNSRPRSFVRVQPCKKHVVSLFSPFLGSEHQLWYNRDLVVCPYAPLDVLTQVTAATRTLPVLQNQALDGWLRHRTPSPSTDGRAASVRMQLLVPYQRVCYLW